MFHQLRMNNMVHSSPYQNKGLASAFWHLTNEDLKPEIRTSYDAQSMGKINKSLAILANEYYSLVSDLVLR